MNLEKYEQFETSLKMFSGFITEPDLRYFESGKALCTFAIPLKKDKKDDPVYLNCETWGRIAEKAGELKKGDEVTVLGKFKEVEYKAKDGTNKTKIVFIVKGII